MNDRDELCKLLKKIGIKFTYNDVWNEIKFGDQNHTAYYLTFDDEGKFEDEYGYDKYEPNYVCPKCGQECECYIGSYY